MQRKQKFIMLISKILLQKGTAFSWTVLHVCSVCAGLGASKQYVPLCSFHALVVPGLFKVAWRMELPEAGKVTWAESLKATLADAVITSAAKRRQEQLPLLCLSILSSGQRQIISHPELWKTTLPKFLRSQLRLVHMLWVLGFFGVFCLSVLA